MVENKKQNKRTRFTAARNAKWAKGILDAFAEFHEEHAKVRSWSEEVETVSSFSELDLAVKQARGNNTVALDERDEAVASLKAEVAGWAGRLKRDRANLDPAVYQGLGRDPFRILQAGADLIELAEPETGAEPEAEAAGDESYISDLKADIEGKVASCEAAIEKAYVAQTALRSAIAERHTVAVLIESMVTPFRYTLEAFLGKGDRRVRALRLPRPGSREAMAATATASSVSLVLGDVDTGDPSTDVNGEETSDIGGAHDDDVVAA